MMNYQKSMNTITIAQAKLEMTLEVVIKGIAPVKELQYC